MEVVILKTVTRAEHEDGCKTKRAQKTRVNLQILDKIYKLKSWNELVAKPVLFNKVLANGYYKAAVCDVLNIYKQKITVDGVEHVFLNTLSDVGDIRRLVKGDHPDGIKPTDVNLVDEYENGGT